MSQPAVAEQIRKLEQALGADLFVRAGRGVVPTERGARLRRARRAQPAARSRTRPAASDELTALRGGTVAPRHLRRAVGLAYRRARRGVPAAPSRRRVRLVGRNSSVDRRAGPARRARGRRRAAPDRRRPARRPPVRARRGALRERLSRAHAAARRRSSSSPRRRWCSTTPSPPTTTRSAASSPSGRRPSASGCGRRSRWSSRTSRCGSSPPGSATPTSPAPTRTRRTIPAGLHTAPFSPALYDTFAIVTRAGARLSPGVRVLLADLEAHMRAVADGARPRALSYNCDTQPA